MRTIKSYSEIAITSSQPPSLTFFRSSKAGKGVGKLYNGKIGRLQICPDWKLFALGKLKTG